MIYMYIVNKLVRTLRSEQYSNFLLCLKNVLSSSSASPGCGQTVFLKTRNYTVYI